MIDVKKILERMLKTKEVLEKDIELLAASQNISIISSQYSWSPTKDSIWVFKTNYVDRIDQDKFVSAFCANDYFRDLIYDNDDVVICPIGIFNDGSLGKGDSNNSGEKLRRVINPALKGIKEIFGNEEWWEDEDCMDGCTVAFNKSLDDLEKITYHGYCGKQTLKGSVIFHVQGADFATRREIENFLIDLEYCAGHALLDMVHFKVSNKQVTVFEYDCESG